MLKKLKACHNAVAIAKSSKSSTAPLNTQPLFTVSEYASLSRQPHSIQQQNYSDVLLVDDIETK